MTGGAVSADAGVAHLATSTSADLAGILSDETGSGASVFGTSPTLTTPSFFGAIGSDFDLGTHADVYEIANEGTTGTVANKLAKLTGAPATAILIGTSDATGISGVVVSGAGTTGNAALARAGQASCVFDGATTAGDYAQASTTVAGDCHDAGPVLPSGGQILGRVLSSNASGGTYAMTVYSPGITGPGTVPLVIDASSALTPETVLIKANATNRPEDRALVLLENQCSVTSITRSGTTATATCASGGTLAAIPSVSIICVYGAVQPEYDGCFTATRVTPSPPVWTYVVNDSPATPATATPGGITAGIFSAGFGSSQRPTSDISAKGLAMVNGANAAGNVEKLYCDAAASRCVLSADSLLGWSPTTGTAGQDSGVARVAPGVLSVDSSTRADHKGWLQWGGQCFLSADATNATASLASSGCSITVSAGRKYGFECRLFLANSVASEGVTIDFNGGTATATNFRAQARGVDTALDFATSLTSLTATAGAATFTGDGEVTIDGAFEPLAGGTFIPRFAENTHTSGTLTLYRGSSCRMWDFP